MTDDEDWTNSEQLSAAELDATIYNLKPPSAPIVKRIEPDVSGGNIWTCDPRAVNIISINGANIPYSTVVFFKSLVINWQPASGATPITTPNPGGGRGGAFPAYPLNSLIFGMGRRYIGGVESFALEGPSGSEIWVAVNDSNYGDNSGLIQVRVRGR
ncbi:hypothetical protein M1D34_07455 [Ensifer sp. D2-11]